MSRRKKVDYSGFIREAREKLGLTQIELAHRLGTSTRTIKRYEAGASPVPRPTVEMLKNQIEQFENA